MADEKKATGHEEQAPPAGPSGSKAPPAPQAEQQPVQLGIENLDAPASDKKAEKSGPDHAAPVAEPKDGSKIPDGKVIDITGKVAQGAEVPAPGEDKKAAKAAPEKTGQDAPAKKGKTKAGPEKADKAPTPRKGTKDKSAPDKGQRDKVSQGKAAPEQPAAGGGSGPAASPAPEAPAPAEPTSPPRPVEEGKLVYLKLSELHPFHTFRAHPFKVRDDVRIIFGKYVHEGYGAQRIATYLNKLGYRARSGKMWHHATIRGIICNLTYTGVLRSGESRSQVLPHLQIISPELFEAAQHIRTSRANSAEAERTVPRNIAGNSLLSGNVFCGHCGSRLNLTTNGKAYPCKDDPNRIVKRVRYICYGKTRKQTECDGQTGYTAHILDGIIDKLVRQIFERMKSIPKEEIVGVRYREKMEERKGLLRTVKAEYAKAAAELDMLKAEIIKSLRGESTFSKELLGSMVAESETKCLELQKQFEEAQAAYNEGQAVMASLSAQYDDIISWADMYDAASMEAKKMIVNCLIKRVEVYRDYKLHIDFNIDFEQFSLGMDIVNIAA